MSQEPLLIEITIYILD